MFIRIVESHLWDVIRFLLHQSRVTQKPEDALYHQQQAVLRNSTSEPQSILRMIMLMWSWRSSAERAYTRSLPLIALISFHFAAFTAAGLFASRVVLSSSEVLIRDGHDGTVCGTWNYQLQGNGENLSADAQGFSQQTQAYQEALSKSMEYERACYSDSRRVDYDCDIFTVRRINATVNQHWPCFFTDPSTCISELDNIQIDTGYINSNEHLGINAPRQDSVDYRKITECAPINYTKWASATPSAGPPGSIPGNQYEYIYLGPTVSSGDFYANYTFAISNFSRSLQEDAYVLDFVLSTPGNPYQTSFLPNHTFFNQTNQDFLLISLSSIALYTAPVFDDWFYATTEETETASLAFPYENAYYQNSWTSIMACTERHQFCNPNLGTGSPASCTSFNGSNALFFDDLLQNNGSNIHLNNRQWATTFRLLMTLDQSAISSVLDYLDTTTLDAEAYLFGASDFENDFSQPLPNNQWQIEVINWHNITMANMQRWALLYAQNGNGPEDVPFIQSPTTPEEKDMCSNQRYRPTGVMSFSGLGVVVVLGLGSLIILANLFLPSIVGFFQTGKYHQKQWAFDETIQLQRMAFEGAGQGTWRNKESQIPLTEKGEKFCHVARFSSGLEADYHYLDTKPQANIGIAI